jgi:hypothetical protein
MSPMNGSTTSAARIETSTTIHTRRVVVAVLVRAGRRVRPPGSVREVAYVRRVSGQAEGAAASRRRRRARRRAVAGGGARNSGRRRGVIASPVGWMKRAGHRVDSMSRSLSSTLVLGPPHLSHANRLSRARVRSYAASVRFGGGSAEGKPQSGYASGYGGRNGGRGKQNFWAGTGAGKVWRG